MAKLKIKKGAKRKFFEVSVPLISTKAHVYGYDVSEFEGKTILIDLTRNLKGKNLELKAKMNIVDNKIESTPISLALVQSYVRRMMRKGTDYIEDSFSVECKDGTLRIKPFIITRKKVSRAIRNDIRTITQKHIQAHCKIREINEIFGDIMANKLQKDISIKAKKIYPLSLCEIRVAEIEKKKE